MGKSRKKTPIAGLTSSGGQKQFRTQEHGKARVFVKNALKLSLSSDFEQLEEDSMKIESYSAKKYGNEWASPRDGKSWYGCYKNDFSTTWACLGLSDLRRDKTPHEWYLEAIRK